jgi:hypothetical protein
VAETVTHVLSALTSKVNGDFQGSPDPPPGA